MKIKQITFGVGLALLILLFIKSCLIPNVKNLSEDDMSEEQKEQKIRSAINEYTSLFSDSIKRLLKPEDTYVRKSKHPYSIFLYNGSSILFVHKIDLKQDLPLKNLIEVKNKTSDVSTNVVYAGFDGYGIQFRYSSEYDSLIRKVFVYSQGNLSSIEHGDTIFDYVINTNNISFKYEEDGVTDFIFKREKSKIKKGSDNSLSINLLFYKKNKSLYIIALHPFNKGAKIKHVTFDMLE